MKTHVLKYFLKLVIRLSLLLRVGNTNHNHEQCDEQVMNGQTLSNSLKREAVEDICIRSAKLIRSKLRKGDLSMYLDEL